MKNIKQLFNSMGLLATPSNLDLFIDSVDEALYELRLQKIQRIPEGESFGTAMARKYRPTTNSQEEEFAEEQRELEREAAETESANTNEMIQRLKVIESLRQGSLPAEYEEELIEEEGQIIEALNESGEKWKPEVGEKLTANFSKPPFAKIESLDLTNLATDEIQPAPGVFVPESEIERLRREVDDAWRESDFYDSYEAVKDFLKAIDKEGGQNE